ncbi:MAG: VWA domain-containing protein [Planctomycetes bacterium]|nr:VWA domain-containing protein [Planctomycetota bacterium]
MINQKCCFCFYIFTLIICAFSQICHADGKVAGIAALKSGIGNEVDLVRVKDGLLVRNGLALKVITKKEAMIHRHSDNSSPVTEKVGIFMSLFVFSPDPESNKQDTTTNGFYRVGQSPDKEKIMGWVNKKDVLEWNCREVAGFAPLAGRKPAKIYKTKEDLIAVIHSGDPDARNAISGELPALSVKRQKVLLPILDTSIKNVVNQNTGLCQVAFLGSPDAAIVEMQPDRPIPDGYGQIDIMFVIDTTRGMKPYVDGLRGVAKPLSKLIRQHPDISARFGIVAYRDPISSKHQKKTGYIHKTYTALTDNFDGFKAALDSVVVSTAGSENTPEAVFDGLNEAINAHVGWRKHGVKVIILIGDASTDVSEVENPSGYTLNGLLYDAAARAILIDAIMIDGGDEEDYRKQEEQWKSLAKGTTLGTKGSYTRLTKGSHGVKELMNKINETLNRKFDLTQKLYELARMPLVAGKIKRSLDISEVEFMVFKNLDTSPVRKKVENHKINFSTGWVQLEQNGIPIIKSHIMMSDEELELLSYVLDSLLIIVKGKYNTIKITKNFIQVLQSISGEEFDEGEAISVFMKEKMGIPVQTGALRFTLTEIREWSKSKLKSKLKSIREKSKSLRSFHGDRANWHAVTDDHSCAYVPVSLLP